MCGGMPSGQPTLIVIGGPTASGKTHVAASVGRHFGSEVISADSRQFYHAMRIGTARPGDDELLGVKHHFLGHLELEQTWSAGEFARQAEPVLQDVLRTRKIAVLVGGSGLYIDALCKGLDPLPVSDHKVRQRLQEQFKRDGLEALTEQLHALDEVTWNAIDRKNPHRVIRALEICLVSGKAASTQRSGTKDRDDMRIVRIALDPPRAELYARIDARVDMMMEAGLAAEARSLLPHRHLNALNTVGYKELYAHFDGALSLVEAVALVKQHTRNYAKRQSTWLRRDPSWQRMPPDATEIITWLDRHVAAQQ